MHEAGSICLRIAIIPSWYNSCVAPARGSFVKAQAEGLHSRGHEVLLLVPDRDSDCRLLHPNESVENGLKCIRISVPSPWHRVLGFYLPGALSSVFSKQISKFSPDVVHAHAVRPAGVLAACALKHTSIPFVLTEHSGPLKKFWWTPHGKRHIALAYENASRLFAVSDFLRLEMISYFGNSAYKATVLPNGVDTKLFSSTRHRPDKGRLLFVGALEKEKGLHILLNALAMLPEPLPWTLTVIGSGTEAGRLRNQASELNLLDKIEWLGSLPHEDMPVIYASHDYVVVPSLHETFSMVCAEALACARPVIASRCGGPEEVVPNYGGRLFPPGNVDALSMNLSEALHGLIHFEGACAVEYIREKFSMDGLINRLESVYEGLIETGV